MELDNLKRLWNDQDQKWKHQTSDDQIVIMLQKRSQNHIAKMKRNLFGELIAVILLYSLAILYFLFTSQGRYWEIAVLLFLVGIAFLFYYYRKNKLLGEMQCVTCEVRSNLQKQLMTLEKYVQFYFLSGIVLTPVAYIASALIVWLKSPFSNSAARLLDAMDFFMLILIGTLITIGTYFLTTWYIKKLYGQHIKKLKHLLQEMEETDPGS